MNFQSRDDVPSLLFGLANAVRVSAEALLVANDAAYVLQQRAEAKAHATEQRASMNERMRFNPAEAAIAGDADARTLLQTLANSELANNPAGLLSDAMAEIIGLAVENRIDECTACLEAFCGVLGPALRTMVHVLSPDSEAERIAGAKECIAALVKLEQSADNLPDEANDGAVFLAIQARDAETLISRFAPLTPRQEGAFRTLAEYIHFGSTTGWPDLERWPPVVADTPAELQAAIDAINSDDIPITGRKGGEL